MKHIYLIFAVMFLAANTACAASFDCAKASTKVEKMICADVELSKLDGKLGKSYSNALELFTSSVLASEDGLKQQQRKWLKERNKCASKECLKTQYQEQIALLGRVAANAQKVEKTNSDTAKIFAQSGTEGKERYGLLMSKDDDLCNHMLELFNSDLEKYGPTGDVHQKEHEEFRRVPWKQGKYFRFNRSIDKMRYRLIEGALFDFNNDGVDELIVRFESWLSNVRAHNLTILAKDKAQYLNNLDHDTYLLNAINQIYLAGNSYPLSELPETISDLSAGDLRVLEPFIYRNKSYLLMRSLFEVYKTRSGVAVIAKYQEGRFVWREITGKMDDICYFTRSREVHK